MHADIFKVYLKKKNYSRVIIFQQKKPKLQLPIHLSILC